MKEEQRQAKSASLQHCVRVGEEAYADMFDAHSFRDASDCYRDAKDSFLEAIALAKQLGLVAEQEALSERLAQITAIFHSQFSV